jgi:two-component system sensor histidine kinase and response regulator WspE
LELIELDDFLLSLFRDEVGKFVQMLNDGLVALEQDTTNTQPIEPLMRAAHSIKGAARVVSVEPALHIAHAMEDCFVATGQGKLTLSSGSIDVLLEAVDWITRIAAAVGPDFATWVEQQQPAMNELLERLRGVREGRAVESRSGEASRPALGPAESSATSSAPPAVPTAADDVAQVQPAQATDPIVATTVAVQPGAVTSPGPRASAESGQSVVRVAAHSLTRLLGLAGESLVEARWLQPFAKSLLNLRREHDRLADLLEGLDRTLPDSGRNAGSFDMIVDMRQRLAHCREQLTDRIEVFDNHGRTSDDLNTRLYNEIIASRMRPFADGTLGFPRLVRDLARELGKKVRLEVTGEETTVDRDVLEKLDAPLNHVVRNAIDHGIETPADRVAAGKPETAQLRINARHSAGMLVISISDDGRGIDVEEIRAKVVERKLATVELASRMSNSELLDFLFLPGFSTREQVTEVSGRGVGLDVVQTMLRSVHGSVQIQTQPGRGTTFRLQLPVTLSVIRAVLVEIGGERYAFPHNRIDRLMRLPRTDLQSLEHRHYFTVEGRHVGVVMGRQLLRLEGQVAHEELPLVFFSSHSDEYAIVVDAFLGEQDLVVRPLDSRLDKVPNISAAAVLDDGSPVLIIDLDDVRTSITRLLETGRLERVNVVDIPRAARNLKRILVVDDSITVREVERQLLAARGYEVVVAVDGVDGWDAVRSSRFDLVVTDIDMPRMDGLDFTQRIKRDEGLRAIPVVIVSYKDSDTDRFRGLEAGANYYLTKSSYHDKSLLNAVEELIGVP